jgi:hypothetical protein
MDIDKLLKALDKDSNEGLLNMTSAKIKQINSSVLSELQLSRDYHQELMHKLKDYKYVDEMTDLHVGSYIRWIPLTNPSEIRLKQGSILCEIKITDDGLSLVCKGVYNRHFQIKFDENLIFQRLSEQEQVLLSALDHLAK